MKLIKYLPILPILIILSGCSNDYELIIDNNTINEKVNFEIKNEDYDKAILINRIFTITNNILETDTKEDIAKKVINDLRGNNFKPSYESDDLYNKKVNGDNIELNYTFKSNDFKTSNIFTYCFGNYFFDSNEDYYLIKGSGGFSCLINSKMTIAIKSKYRIIDNNADKIKGNVYYWNFNSENNLDKELYIQVSKKYKNKNNSNNYWLITLVLILSIIILVKNKKLKD